MFIDHTNLRKTLRALDKNRVLEIFCNRNVSSTCSLFVFTQILKSELFKYQIEFKEMEKDINFIFKIEDKEFILRNGDDNCTCHRKDTSGIIQLYKTVKSMDFIKIETLWPIAVCFAHYKTFLNEKRYQKFIYEDKNKLKDSKSSDDFSNKSNLKDIPMKRLNNYDDPLLNNDEIIKDEFCSVCQLLKDEIFYSIRMLNGKTEGLLIQKKNRLDFLSGSTLFRAIKNDLNFIHQKKLFYNKNGNVDRKIGEYLAKYGVSINSANSPYYTLDSVTKKHCNTIFGEEEKFVYKNGHDIEITAIEHSFLILFYLYKENDMFAYLCLEKRKLIDVEKVCKFYEKIVIIFKETILSASKAGNLGIFKVKSQGFTISQLSVLSYLLYQFIKIYLLYREETHLKICISYDFDESNQLLYSEDLDFTFLKEFKTDVNENLIKIEKKNFVEIIRDLAVNL